MGADFAYIGSPFLASTEANTSEDFKAMIVECDSKDIVITNCFTGVNATFLLPSIEANGLDANKLVREQGADISIKDGGSNAKAWRDIWSAGQGIGAVSESGPAAAFIDKLVKEYAAERAAWGLPPHHVQPTPRFSAAQ
jgi:nitronate monooxygenase